MSNDSGSLAGGGLEKADGSAEAISAVGPAAEAVKNAGRTISNSIESGKRPVMPLSILSNIAREAPLGSLLVAFLIGFAFARRR
jgi:hypothetical protein